MPENVFPFDLNPDSETATDQLHIRIAYELGALTDFSVQYETIIGGTIFVVVRYDASHAEAHRHLFDRHGATCDRKPYPNSTFDQILDHAMRDLKTNWRRYRTDFIWREGVEL